MCISVHVCGLSRLPSIQTRVFRFKYPSTKSFLSRYLNSVIPASISILYCPLIHHPNIYILIRISKIMDVDLPTLKCAGCGHKWHPRHQSLPKICPKCKRRGVLEYVPQSLEIIDAANTILKHHGFVVETEYDCAQLGRIDLIASKDNIKFVIEVKPSGNKTNVLFGVGQLLYYESILNECNSTKLFLSNNPIVDESLITFFKTYHIEHTTISELDSFCKTYRCIP